MQATVNRKLSNTVAASAILQFPGVFFMILFWIFTSDPGYYSPDCVDMLEWSQAVLYLSCLGFFLSLLSIPFMYLAIFMFKSILLFNSLAYFYIAFTAAYMLSIFVVFTGICSTYSEDEDCGDLRILNAVYIAIYSILITLASVWGCLICFCTYRHRKKKKKSKEQESYKEFTEEKEENPKPEPEGK